MGAPTYLRNYVQTSTLRPGMPIRSVYLDNPNDVIVREIEDGILYFQDEDRSIDLSKVPAQLRFPYRSEDDGGQIDWSFAPLVSDLAAGDRLLYLGDTIVVHDVYRRPGADWVRLTTTMPRTGRGTSTTRTFCKLTDKVSWDNVFDGSLYWEEFPLETAGPYLHKDQDESCMFYVSPIGRGYTWRVGLEMNGPERVAPSSLADLKRDYVFVGMYPTQRHPNDGNVRRRSFG